MMKPELKAVLAECNLIRKTLGLPPRLEMLKGRRLSACRCPVARTIGCGTMNTHSGWLRPNDVFGKGNGSLVLIDFAYDFDAGEYPELEMKS